MATINDPASPNYEYDGTMSTSDLAAATITRLRRLTPALTTLADQLGHLGLTGQAINIEALTAPWLIAMIAEKGRDAEKGNAGT